MALPSKNFAAAVAALALATTAQAAVVTSTVGYTTTYTENFDSNSTSFTLSGPAMVVNAPFTADDYLMVSGANGAAAYTIAAPGGLKSLSIAFWYGASAAGDGVAELNGTVYNTAPNGMPFFTAYVPLNPGPGGSDADSFFTTSWSDLAPGNYTFNFRTGGQTLDSFKLDDVVITATVPEPGSLALLLAALAGAGVVARRRGRA